MIVETKDVDGGKKKTKRKRRVRKSKKQKNKNKMTYRAQGKVWKTREEKGREE